MIDCTDTLLSISSSQPMPPLINYGVSGRI